MNTWDCRKVWDKVVKYSYIFIWDYAIWVALLMVASFNWHAHQDYNRVIKVLGDQHQMFLNQSDELTNLKIVLKDMLANGDCKACHHRDGSKYYRYSPKDLKEGQSP